MVKFGGSVLGRAEDLRRAASYVRDLIEERVQPVVVVSALRGTTQLILDAYETERREPIDEVVRNHESIIEELGEGRYARAARELLEELRRTFDAFLKLAIHVASVRDLLLSFGERLAINLLAESLTEMSLEPVPLFGREAGIITDERFGEASPTRECCVYVREKLLRQIDSGRIPLIAGFIGETASGRITTMGRGGSDYTATFVGKCLGASEVRLITDVPGIFTGDPKLFPNARLVPRLSFEEAIELSHLGGKKFHPRTFEPLLGTSVNVRVTRMNSSSGTLVSGASADPPLKSVTMSSRLELLVVRGASMVGRLGTAARVLSLLSSSGINVIAMAQPASETSMNFLVEGGSHRRISSELQELADSGYVRDYSVEENVAAVSVIGHGIGDPSVFALLLEALRGAELRMIARGPLDLSLTLVAEEREAARLAGELHSIVVSQEGFGPSLRELGATG
ncbi:MAG: aspartate kinase [Fervidicoccaceae archaeon]